ncbi:hypothetical protein COLO4_03017 [Corchorus olitorius]|uniref:Uncharacterized protein n=1 Tax=Corchorus olitorius TaxID=93759 RepID=A0A1R3KZT9_9ROSI|nr:hypothetical protein COLO4_03017 [Corchorus olitorius]
MEERGLPLSMLNPLNSGFLSPKNLFLFKKMIIFTDQKNL